MMIRLSSMKIALLISTIYSRISLEQMKTAFDEVFKDREGDGLKYTIINPLFGYMFRVNGCAENMRFYSPELEIKYAKGARNYKLDDSKDSLTKLVIHLFPSHTGTFNNLIGKNANFTYKYFKSHKPYDEENRDNNREANIKMLGDTFVELLKNGTKKNFPKPSKSQKTPYTEFRYYVTIPNSSSHLKYDEIYIKLLTLYAYALEESESENELKINLKAISDGLGDIPTEKYPALCLNNKQKELFKRLYTNPFKFPYSKINQPVSNSSIPIYDRKNDTYEEDKKFPDCVDIVILHLCNCLFFDDKTGKCSLNQLKLTEPNRLTKFYEDYHFRPFGITQEMRNEWSRIVQGLDDNEAFECQDNYKPYLIHYLNQDYRNEIKSGLLNTMSVLASICGINDAYKEIMTKEPIPKDSVVGKLTEFFKKISNETVKVTIKGKDIEKIEYNNVGDFTGSFHITLDLEKSKTSIKMKLHILHNHTSFFFEGMKSKHKAVDFSGLRNIKSDSNNLLLSLLISRYIRLYNNNDDKTDNFDCPFEALYNQGILLTNEQKRDQCIHLCEYIKKIKKEERTTVKKIIENIVKSANLSDPATRTIFRPLFIYIDDLFAKMSSYEVFETCISLFSEKSETQSQSIRNTWNEAVKKSSMKIRSMRVGNDYANSFDSVKTILPVIKDTLENLKLVYLARDPEKVTQMVQELLVENTTLKALAIIRSELSPRNILSILDSLKNNESLKTLDISHNHKFGAKDAKRLANALESITSLTTLNISGLFSGTAGINFVMNSLQKSKILARLMPSVFSAAAGIQCIVDILEKNKTLTTLDISKNNFGSRDTKIIADALKKNTTLTTLRISDSNLDAESIKHIAEVLKINITLTALDISNNYKLGSKGLECIADALESNTTLTTLNISHICVNENTDKFAERIVQIIKGKSKLTSLNISGNSLRAKNTKCIAKALRSNTTLTELDISRNAFQDKGAGHIASIFVENKVLKKSSTSSSNGCANKTLKKLNVSYNDIKREGAKHIADAIEKSETLVYLDINGSNIENEGISRIANALVKNEFLKVLKIQFSYFDITESKRILDALKENKSLVELNLNYYGTDNEMAEVIADVLKKNKSLEILKITLPRDTPIETIVFLYETVKNTTLKKVTFRKEAHYKITMSDRMPIENDTDCNTNNQSSEFQRIEIHLNG